MCREQSLNEVPFELCWISLNCLPPAMLSLLLKEAKNVLDYHSPYSIKAFSSLNDDEVVTFQINLGGIFLTTTNGFLHNAL